MTADQSSRPSVPRRVDSKTEKSLPEPVADTEDLVEPREPRPALVRRHRGRGPAGAVHRLEDLGPAGADEAAERPDRGMSDAVNEAVRVECAVGATGPSRN